MMRLAPALLVLALAACHKSADARQSGQVRYQGHTLAEWWTLRRDPDEAKEHDAQMAMHMIGAAAVPFLADKAASHDMAEMIGGSTALEGLCTSAIPAMEAARAEYPSPALDEAIRRVRREAADRVRFGLCTASGEPTRPGSQH